VVDNIVLQCSSWKKVSVVCVGCHVPTPQRGFT